MMVCSKKTPRHEPAILKSDEDGVKILDLSLDVGKDAV